MTTIKPWVSVEDVARYLGVARNRLSLQRAQTVGAHDRPLVCELSEVDEWVRGWCGHRG